MSARLALGAVFVVACAACARTSPHADALPSTCGFLAVPACDRARALALAAITYEDEAHDYVLASAAIPAQTSLARTAEGWRSLPLACARPPLDSAPALDPTTVDYAFVGVTIDATLVSADADVGPLLARANPPVHAVRLVALAFVHDRAAPVFAPSSDLLEKANGDCSCGEATHFAGGTKYGAMLAYDFTFPRRAAREPIRALDVVRAALADARVAVHESNAGAMVIDGLAPTLARGAAVPLRFRVTNAVPLAYAVSPVAELCEFPTPELSPSPIDFGIAPYGTEARRAVHAVNRASIDLRADIGASSFLLPARGAIDLPLTWTPDGDAPGCETQTRDEAIPFLRPGGGTPRLARVLETVRTGRASLERREPISASPPGPPERAVRETGSAARDWSCPRDFVRTACRVENASGSGIVAEPRPGEGCHFTCGSASACRFDAVMTCALSCGR